MEKKAVVIFSGGADSVTLLHYIKSLNYRIYGLSFNYHQRHIKELKCAKYWGEKLCEEHKIVKLDFMKDVAGNSALTGNKKVPTTHYTDESQKSTAVPNRNMVMLSIAIAWAESLVEPIHPLAVIPNDYNSIPVFYGPHYNDFTIYPDCRPAFVEALSKASQLGTYSQVKVEAPFVHFTKAQIIGLGLKLGVLYEKTWSCYEGKEKACGLCGTCQERLTAFEENNVVDPIEYERH